MASTIPNSNQGGRQKGHRFKSLLVWQYLFKHADEENAVQMSKIKQFLEAYDIYADRHSIARDIKELQTLADMEYKNEISNRNRLGFSVEYDEKQKGYLLCRPYSFEEMKLLAECVNAAKFLTDAQAEGLKSMIGGFCSKAQAERLKNEVYVVGRVKTTNKHVIASIMAINEAIKRKKKIKFTYLKYTLQNKDKQTPRRRGTPYEYSPYQLIIDNGNYYVVCYSSKKKGMVHYRVDRMQDVKVMDDPREGEEVFAEMDMETYTQRVFGMFGGDTKRVTIRFTNDLLDTAIERFGRSKDVFYAYDDAGHFTVSTDVQVSDQFYSWICGFRKKAKIVNPPEVVEGMKRFLDDVYRRYESE